MTIANEEPQPDVDFAFEQSLRRIGSRLPKPVRYRIENAFLHIDRSLILLAIDREMASFRAITGEEEAATALLIALRLRNYPNWHRLNKWFHAHKAAVLVAAEAIQLNYARGLERVHLTVDVEKRRIDVKIPLADLGVTGPASELWLQPVEPLDLTHARQGENGAPDYEDDFERDFTEIVTASTSTTIEQLINARANQRNTLLYASDHGLPESRFDLKAHAYRKRRTMVMVASTIMVLQSDKHQATVIQAMRAILKIVPRLRR